MRRQRFLQLCALLLFIPALVCARDAREQARIDFPIHRAEASPGVMFVRNGSDHNATAAAAHLRMKLGYLGDRVKTAEQFVKYCASESSITHQKYRVRLADGSICNAAEYFCGGASAISRGKEIARWSAIRSARAL